MLEQILSEAIPLQEKVTLPDPWGWGTEWEIYRFDATGYQKAEDEVNPQLKLGKTARDAVRKATRRATAQTKGARRGQGGVLVGIDQEAIIEDTFTDELASGFIEQITLEEKIPAIAEHLCKLKVFPEDLWSIWDVPSRPHAEENAPAIEILSMAPKAPGADVPLTYPAAFAGKGDWREDGTAGLEPVWQIEDAKNLSEREQVAYGGFGWDETSGSGKYSPTLNNMLASWILDSSRTTDLFEPKAGEIEEGLASIRPTKDGSGSSSEPEAPKSDDR